MAMTETRHFVLATRADDRSRMVAALGRAARTRLTGDQAAPSA
jgi:hypothetical protein